MAAEGGISVVGFDELIAGSRRLFAKIGERAAEEFGHIAEREATVASVRMPRKTGRMASSVTGRLERNEQKATVGLVKSEVPYAGFVEFGGIRNRPYVPKGRYLFPVALSAEAELKSAGTRAATDEIRGFSWPTPRT